MLRASQCSQNVLTSAPWPPPPSRRMLAKAPYEPWRTFTSVPNTSNDMSLGRMDIARSANSEWRIANSNPRFFSIRYSLFATPYSPFSPLPPEHDRGEPAGEQGERRGRKPVEHAVIVRAAG